MLPPTGLSNAPPHHPRLGLRACTWQPGAVVTVVCSRRTINTRSTRPRGSRRIVKIRLRRVRTVTSSTGREDLPLALQSSRLSGAVLGNGGNTTSCVNAATSYTKQMFLHCYKASVLLVNIEMKSTETTATAFLCSQKPDALNPAQPISTSPGCSSVHREPGLELGRPFSVPPEIAMLEDISRLKEWLTKCNFDFDNMTRGQYKAIRQASAEVCLAGLACFATTVHSARKEGLILALSYASIVDDFAHKLQVLGTGRSVFGWTLFAKLCERGTVPAGSMGNPPSTPPTASASACPPTLRQLDRPSRAHHSSGVLARCRSPTSWIR